MAQLQNLSPRNTLLQALPPQDLAHLGTALRPVRLPSGYPIARAGIRCEETFFLESGICTIVGQPEGRPQGLTLVGPEGLCCTSTILDTPAAPYDMTMLVAGEGFRIDADMLRAFMHERHHLSRILTCYVQALLVQVLEEALSAMRNSIQIRIARLILMAQDRLGDRTIPVTHDTVAFILGVRRPGVTIAMQVLEGERLIRNGRGRIEVLDRDGLLTMTKSSGYGLAEAAYREMVVPVAPMIASEAPKERVA